MAGCVEGQDRVGGGWFIGVYTVRGRGRRRESEEPRWAPPGGPARKNPVRFSLASLSLPYRGRFASYVTDRRTIVGASNPAAG